MSVDRKALFLKILSDKGLTASEELTRLAIEHTKDLAPLSGRHFTEETEKAITQKSAHQLAEARLSDPAASIADLWRQIVTDYHRSRQWGFPSSNKKEDRPAELTPTREVASYVWTAFQALVLMKCVILFFGLKSAEEPSPWMTAGLVLALAFSFGSLLWFAIRKSRKGSKEASS